MGGWPLAIAGFCFPGEVAAEPIESTDEPGELAAEPMELSVEPPRPPTRRPGPY